MVRRPHKKRLFLLASLCGNLGILGTFKYFNFFDGAKVYVVQIPMAGSYLDLLKEFRGNPYGEFRERIPCAVGHLPSRVMFWEEPAVAGLTDQDYRDWGHLNTRGAHKWSEFFVDWLNGVNGVGTVEEGGSGDSATCERQEP